MIPPARSALCFRIARRCVVLLVCFSLGMHWAVLQGVAWAGMFVANLDEGSVTEAVKKTFDGEHPCPLCLAIQEGQKKEKDDSKPLTVKSVKKFEAVLVAETRLVTPPAQIRSFPRLVSSFEEWSERPSMPPPRV